jgi:hypothetical protein
MKSVCSNCGGDLVHGNALGACTRCGHALTGALWTLEPPSQRIISRKGGWSRVGLQVLAGVFAGCVASTILFGLIRAEQEASAEKARAIITTQHALRPGATGLSPGSDAPQGTAITFSGSGPLLHANAPARPLGAIANINPDADGGRSSTY